MVSSTDPTYKIIIRVSTLTDSKMRKNYNQMHWKIQD